MVLKGAIFALSFIVGYSARADERLPEINIGQPHIELPDNYSTLGERGILEAASPVSEDVLRGFPGLTVSRSGGAGQSSFVFIRGADSAGTLVLLDGFPLNDPSLSSAAFDFSNLNLDNIERIEVWKGPQSVLFGSGAIGGVINLVSKRGEGAVRPRLRLAVGSQNTESENLGVQGSSARWFYSLSARHERSEGISASGPSHGGVEKDGSAANAFSARIGWTPVATTEVEVLARWSERRADLDYAPSPVAPDFILADDPNYSSRGRTLALALTARERWSPDFDSILSASRVAQDRSYRNEPDSLNPGWVEGSYSGSALRLENRNRWRLTRGTDLLFGPAAVFESADSTYVTDSFQASFPRQSDSLIGFLARLQRDSENLFFTVGARVDRHSLFGAQESYEVSPGLHFGPALDLFVRGSMAYKAPTLFELYDPLSGNKALRPEHVQGFEISVARYFVSRKNKVQLSGFVNQSRELIQWQSLRYVNVGSAVVRGAEFESAVAWGWLSMQGGYTYLETRDDSSGARLLRRPRGAVTARMAASRPDWDWGGALELGGAGSRADVDPISGARVTSGRYSVLSASLDWRISPALAAHLSVVNLLDLKYEEVAGYGREPFSLYLSLVLGGSN